MLKYDLNNIDDLLKRAMIDKDKKSIAVLRDIKGRLNLKRIELKQDDLTDIEKLNVVKSMCKARQQSIDAFMSAERMDLVDKEQYELTFLEHFLPPKLTEPEIKHIVRNIISQNKFTSMKDMGKIMKEFNSHYPGQDGKLISDIVKKLLK